MAKPVDWYCNYLPFVNMQMSGDLASLPQKDENTIGAFDNNYVNWRIEEDHDEFVIRFSRKPGAPSRGSINIGVTIDGGLSKQPDGSEIFDGLHGNSSGVSTFGILFKITEEPKLCAYPEHNLQLASEDKYNNALFGKPCNACAKPVAKGNAKWVYECTKPGCDYRMHAHCLHTVSLQLEREIQHKSHPQHALTLYNLAPGNSRSCDVCKTAITGVDYHCVKCNFDVHPKCPEPHHHGYPEHKLQLAPENKYNDVKFGRPTCYTCTRPITKGNAKWVYECNKPGCNYRVHAPCLPGASSPPAREIRHASHAHVALTLCKIEPGGSRPCDVCKADITGINYHCAQCKFFVHPECPDPHHHGYSNSDRASPTANNSHSGTQAAVNNGYSSGQGSQAAVDNGYSYGQGAPARVMSPQEFQVFLMNQQMQMQWTNNLVHQNAVNWSYNVANAWSICNLID